MQKDKEPSRPLEPVADVRTVRERTIAHLDNLMRAAVTMVGTGALLASGAQDRQSRPVVVDPPPPPPPECCEHPDQFLVRGCTWAVAVWAKVDGQWVLRLSLHVRNLGPVGFVGLGKTDIKLSGITLKELHTMPYQVDLVLAPVGDEKSPSLELLSGSQRTKDGDSHHSGETDQVAPAVLPPVMRF